jgi:hypothetical protein
MVRYTHWILRDISIFSLHAHLFLAFLSPPSLFIFVKNRNEFEEYGEFVEKEHQLRQHLGALLSFCSLSLSLSVCIGDVFLQAEKNELTTELDKLFPNFLKKASLQLRYTLQG